MSVRSRTGRISLALVAIGVLHLVGEIDVAHGRIPADGPAPSPLSSPPSVSAVAGSSELAAPTSLHDTFAYAGTDDENQRLVAAWNPTLSKAPWVVTIHGGSWVGGSPSGVRPAVDLFRDHGFQVFNLRYRLAGGVTALAPVTYADQRHDVVTALAWIRAHATAFGIDPNRGVLYGSSAGGNLALAAGLTGDGTNGIRGVVSVSGVVQPTELWNDLLRPVPGRPTTMPMRRLAGNARNAVGCPYPPPAAGGCAARWRAMDVAHEISPHDPPVLMYQGLADRTVPFRMATTFRRQLDLARIGGSLVLVPGLGHNQDVVLDGGARQAAMLAFVEQRTAVGGR